MSYVYLCGLGYCDNVGIIIHAYICLIFQIFIDQIFKLKPSLENVFIYKGIVTDTKQGTETDYRNI